VALIAPEGSVGTVGGIVNFVNNLLGIAAPIVTGFIVGATGSFAAGFVVAAIVLAIGILCYIFLLGRIEQIPSPDTTQRGPAGRPVQDKVDMMEEEKVLGE
jgi:dipeptide/tripeptide permease